MTPNAKREPATGSRPDHPRQGSIDVDPTARHDIVLVESLGTVMTMAECREAVNEVVRWAES